MALVIDRLGVLVEDDIIKAIQFIRAVSSGGERNAGAKVFVDACAIRYAPVQYTVACIYHDVSHNPLVFGRNRKGWIGFIRYHSKGGTAAERNGICARANLPDAGWYERLAVREIVFGEQVRF